MVFNTYGADPAVPATIVAPSMFGLLSWQVLLLGGGLALFLLSKKKR